MRTVSSIIGPSQECFWAAMLEKLLDMNELELQTMPGLASETSTLCATVIRSWLSVGTGGGNRRKIVRLNPGVQHLTSHSEKIRTDAGNQGKRNIHLTGEVQKSNARATVQSVWGRAVTEELASVEPRLDASCVEGGNALSSFHGTASGASMVGDILNKVLTTLSEKAADVTKWKFSIIGLELKDALK